MITEQELTDEIKTLKQSWGGGCPEWQLGERARVIKMVLEHGTPSVVEVGCGGSEVQQILENHGCYVVGTDIQKCDKYFDLAHKRTNFIRCHCCFMPFQEKAFDYATLISVIEHIPIDEGEILNEMKRIASNVVITCYYNDLHLPSTGHRKYSLIEIDNRLIKNGLVVQELIIKDGLFHIKLARVE